MAGNIGNVWNSSCTKGNSIQKFEKNEIFFIRIDFKELYSARLRSASAVSAEVILNEMSPNTVMLTRIASEFL